MNNELSSNSVTNSPLPLAETMGSNIGMGEELEQIQPRYGFRTGNFGILFAPDMSSEIIKDLPMYPVPNTPSWLRGIINLRGNLVPVFDPVHYFDADQDVAKHLQILVFDKGEKAVGLSLYDHPKLLDQLTSASELPDLPEDFEAYILDAFTQDNMIWLDIDFNGFFRALGKKTASY